MFMKLLKIESDDVLRPMVIELELPKNFPNQG
jgi:hypothetical protein